MSDLLAAPRGPQQGRGVLRRLARSRMLWLAGGGIMLAVVLYYAIPDAPPPPPPPPPQHPAPNVAYDPPTAPPQTRAAPPPAPAAMPAAVTQPQAQPAVEEYPRLPPLKMYSFGNRNFTPEYLKPAQAQAEATTKRETDRIAYTSPKVPAIRSMTIKDRTYELPAFSTIPCVLDTAVVTGAAGTTPFRCHVSTPNGRGVQSPAHTVLLEDNTTVGGYYKSVVSEGDNRVVMVTAQAETPFGVVVRFGDMPVADQLGAAGVPGAVDNHWGQRIGGALMLALADTAASLAQAELQNMGRSNNSQFNFGSTGGISGLSQVTNAILGKTINIPPTITLHQGDRILLWVTEMVDFSPSYEVVPRERQ
jgi:type IV secretion system protein VirB10